MDSHLDVEISRWKDLMKKYLKKHFKIYIKGGSVLGLQIIKLLNGLTRKDFDDLLNLNLIRDFDFSLYVPDYQDKLDAVNIAVKDNSYFQLQGTVIYVIRMKNNVMLDQEHFFEMSIKEGHHPFDHLLELEMPMTSMIVEINNQNMDKLFELTKIFFLKHFITDEQVECVNQIIKDIKIEYPPSIDGFQKVEYVDYGRFVEPIKQLITNTVHEVYPEKYNDKPYRMAAEQFVAAQFEQPDRLLIRLINKNIPKSLKIQDFLEKKQIQKDQEWMVHKEKTEQLVYIAVNNLSKLIQNVFDTRWQHVTEIKNAFLKVKSTFEQDMAKYESDINGTDDLKLKEKLRCYKNKLKRKPYDLQEAYNTAMMETFKLIEELFTGMNIGHISSLIDDAIKHQKNLEIMKEVNKILEKLVPISSTDLKLDDNFYKSIKSKLSGNRYLMLITNIFNLKAYYLSLDE